MYTFNVSDTAVSPGRPPDANPTTRRDRHRRRARIGRVQRQHRLRQRRFGGRRRSRFQAAVAGRDHRPAAPGSGWDQTARAVQEALKADDLARSADVKNVPGASGTVALAQVAPQKGKDGLLIASGLAMMSGIITNGTDVTLDDLTPVARVVGEYEVIVVPKDVPYNNADDLFAAIKADPKSVPIAGGSAGSADQIFIGLLAQHYGVKPADVNYVPYSGGGEATTALLGGKVKAGVAGLNEFAEQIKNGNLKGLLISSTEQIEGTNFAQTATQIDPKLEFQNWRSIMAPSGISPELTTQYIEAMKRMHDSSELDGCREEERLERQLPRR